MAFLGVKIPALLGEKLAKIKIPGKREKEEDYHITLLYLGEKVEIEQISKAVKSAFTIIQYHQPFDISINKIGCFTPTEHGIPIIAKISGVALIKLHDELVIKFDQDKITFAKKFKTYRPHITLAYAKEKIKTFNIVKKKIEVTELVLLGGDKGEEKLEVKFALGEKKKMTEVRKNLNKFTGRW